MTDAPPQSATLHATYRKHARQCNDAHALPSEIWRKVVMCLLPAERWRLGRTCWRFRGHPMTRAQDPNPGLLHRFQVVNPSAVKPVVVTSWQMMNFWNTKTFMSNIDRGLRWWIGCPLSRHTSFVHLNLLHALSVTGDLACIPVRFRDQWLSNCISIQIMGQNNGNVDTSTDAAVDILADFDDATVVKLLDMAAVHFRCGYSSVGGNFRMREARRWCAVLDDIQRRVPAARDARRMLLQLTQ